MHLFRSLCLYLVFARIRQLGVSGSVSFFSPFQLVKVVGRWMICWLVNNIHTNDIKKEGEKVQYS